MYRKNVANQYIYFALISTSTGGALTGASVTAYRALDNGSQATATGTTSELGNGQYRFNLSQADTNADEGSYLFIASGASPVEKTVVFTAANPSDGAAFGLSKFADIETDTQDIQTRIPSGLVDGRMAAIAQVVGDKLGYKLASDGLSLVTQWAVAITGNITGNVTGSVGSISGVTFPANFNFLVIDNAGSVSRVTLVDELGAGALSANEAGAPVAGYVWNALTTTAWPSNSFGKTVLVSGSTNRVIKVTGSGAGHVAADLHESQAGSIHETTFDTDAWSARVLASDAATEIATAVAGTQALSRLDSMIESDGAGQFRFDTIALSMAPAGGGGGGGTDWTANERTAIRAILGIPTSGTTPTDPTEGILDEIRDDINSIGINVYPVSASTPERVGGTTLTFYRNESRSVSVVTDFTLTSLTLQFTVEDADGVDVYTLANGSITRSGQTFTVAVTTAVTGNLGQYRWSMRDISGGGSSVIAMGVLTVQEASSNV
jgi:hypothetical protein